MSVDENTVRRIARLARIAVTEEELAPLAKDLTNIIDWVEQLSEVETDHVAPMTSVVETEIKLREDIVRHDNFQREVTQNAPQSEDGFYTVPKVIE